MIRLMALHAALLCSLAPSWGWMGLGRLHSQVHSLASQYSGRSSVIGSFHPMSMATDDEIAELEERLQQLKAEKEAATDEEKESLVSTEAGEGEFLDKGNYRVQPPAEFFTERWKEGEDVENNGSILNVAGALVLVALLVAFSQIPVGSEGLQKYSDKIGL